MLILQTWCTTLAATAKTTKKGVCFTLPLFSRQVEFRLKENVPARPAPTKLWLKETGKLPLGGHNSNSGSPSYDDRAASFGGCDSPGHLEGCQVLYIKVWVLPNLWPDARYRYASLLCIPTIQICLSVIAFAETETASMDRPSFYCK